MFYRQHCLQAPDMRENMAQPTKEDEIESVLSVAM